MAQVLLLLAVGGLMHAVSSFTRTPTPATDMAATGLAFGFLLLVAFFAGRLFKSIGLPRLTGYLAAGVVAGDQVAHLVTHEMVQSLSLVNGVAICLIALTAGGELNFGRIKPLVRVIVQGTLWARVGGALVLGVVMLALRPLVPFLNALSIGEAAAVAALIGVTLSAGSPAVVTAMLNETQADGPLSRTVLALVVLGDLVVIVLFAVVSSVCQGVLGGGADVVGTIRGVAWELFGSMAAGVFIGAALTTYLRRVQTGVSLFVLLICAVVAEVGRRIHLDPLIVMLAAGAYVENVGKTVGSRLIGNLEAASLPVNAVFFALAGAHLRLDLLAASAIPAAIVVLSRAGAFFGGSRIATGIAKADPVVRKYAWYGLLPQAGLALALATLMQRTFPTFGEAAGALVLGVVGVNEFLTPVLLRIALLRSGEGGKKGTMEFGAPVEAGSGPSRPGPGGPPPSTGGGGPAPVPPQGGPAHASSTTPSAAPG